MPTNNKKNKKAGPHEQLKWETARELGLDDDLANPGDELTTREAGKIGGNMVKKLIKAGKQAINRQGYSQQPDNPDDFQ